MLADTDLLVAWVRRGDRSAGNKLILRYFGRVRRFFASKVHPSQVDDLVQRTFAGCVEHVSQFRAEASFTTYIFSIARRQLCRHFRDTMRDAGRNDADAGVSGVQVSGGSPSSVVARAQAEDLVLIALQSLNLDTQTILELHYWEGLPGPEIAEVMDIRPGAVRTRLHRARAALRLALVEVAGTAACTDVDGAARALGVLL